MTKTFQRVDWERIEPAWRAGVKSVLQIAAEYEADTGKSISHTAINKHFKKLGVARDLKGKIQSKADSLVSAATVSAKVSTETTLTDALIINEVAQDVAGADGGQLVRIAHEDERRPARQGDDEVGHEADVHHRHLIDNDHICLQRIFLVSFKMYCCR